MFNRMNEESKKAGSAENPGRGLQPASMFDRRSSFGPLKFFFRRTLKRRERRAPQKNLCLQE